MCSNGAMALAEVPFDLLEVKLAAPQPRPGTAAKADVIASLRGSPVPCVSVVAPAGYGKTTLLVSWAMSDPRPFAWVALDAADDDALVFLRYIAAAIHRVEPVPVEVFHALSGPGGSTWSKRVPRVGSALAALERPLVLVLDDLHAVRNPSCLDALAALFGYLPAGSQIAIASREEPALPLARWRAPRDWFARSVSTDLRLDEQEAELLLAAAGVAPRRDRAHRADRAHGGLACRLVSRSAGVAGGSAELGECPGFAGDDRFVAEYFRVELLSAAPTGGGPVPSVHIGARSHVRPALRRRARRPHGRPTRSRRSSARTASSCRSTGTASGTAITTCSRELLRKELERNEPDVVRELNRRAMAWSIANDMTEAAVVYGHAAGETDTVAGLLDAVALPALLRRPRRTPWRSGLRGSARTNSPISGARRNRRVGATADGTPCRGRALACACRGRDVADPALGRQCDDRAVGRPPARRPDARRCRAGPRRRRPRAGSAVAGEWLEAGRVRASEASRMRCSG